MYGQTTGRKGMARCYCSTRRKREGCDQPLAPAVPIEHQLAEFVSAFTPSPELRDDPVKRRELVAQLFDRRSLGSSALSGPMLEPSGTRV
jgi:hypothetical protein